jgi:nitronate monooxygenase
MLSPDALDTELQRLRDLTDKPCNVNFFCHTLPRVNREDEALWLQTLSGYFAELKLEPPAESSSLLRKPFGEDSLRVLEKYQPAVVSFHFGLPDRQAIARIKHWGGTVLSSATTVEEAQWLVAHGADVIIAQGLEAGGHRGSFLTLDMTTQTGTMVLVPRVRAAVPVPVIAAGGIASAAGVNAALTLGACGVQVGTTFLLCKEASTTALHRAALKSAAAEHTAVTNVFTGRPARSIVNRLVREVGPLAQSATAFPTAASLVSLLRAAAETHGSHDFTPLWCGQNATGCAEIPAADILQNLADGLATTPAKDR